MSDKEKVIKGLYAHGYKDCKSCPYWGTGNNGMSDCRKLAREAYALLKEQENDIHHMGLIIEEYEKELKKQEAKEETPRLLTPEEVQTMKAGTPLVVERFIKHKGKVVPMACWAIHTGGLILSFHGTMFPDTVHKIPYATIVQNKEGKGHHNEYFRFWSDRPTKEQMEKEEWKGIEGDWC